MKRLFLIANIALATLCITTASIGANIKVVCKSDPKHDKAKLIQAMNIAQSGDKIVIIGTCLPKGIQAAARKAYQPKLSRVEVIVTDRPQQYESWRFEREVPYSPVYDRPLPRTVIIDNTRTINVRPGVSGVTRSTGVAPLLAPSRSSAGVKATSTRSTSSKSTTTKTTETNEQAKSEDKDKENAKDNENAKEESKAKDEENAKEEGKANNEENAKEEGKGNDEGNAKDEGKANDEGNAKDEGKANDEGNAKDEAAPEEKAEPQQDEAAPEEKAEPQQEEAAPEQSEPSDSGSESSGGSEGGSESSGDSD